MTCLFNSTGYPVYTTEIVRGSGCYVYDNSGKRYLDLEAGVWCLPLGHMPEKLTLSIQEQMARLNHVGYKYNDTIAETAAEKLVRIADFPDGKCVFLSSGSEAVEYAIQMAKVLRPGKRCICLENQYLAAYGTGATILDAKECHIPWDSRDEKSVAVWREDLLKTMDFQGVGVFVFEAGNSSGFVKLPPANLITALKTLLHEFQILTVVDEVTCGMGRTGRWFGYMNYDIDPDMIAVGKGLGNGYPVSAVILKSEIAAAASELGFHYAQSHQNDPLGCRIALEVVTMIEENRLLDQCIVLGNYLREKYMDLSGTFPFIKEIKGIGLLTAIEFSEQIRPEQLELLDKQLFDAGYIVGMKPAQRTLRTYAPLILEQSMIDGYIAVLMEQMNGWLIV